MAGSPPKPGIALPPGLKTLAILHLAETSGPSKTLRPSLERLAGAGTLEVVVPGPGRAADDYAELAAITELDYAPVTFPRGAREAARAAARLARDALAFRRRIRDGRPDLVVIATSSLPAPLIAARLERVPTIVRFAEILERGHVGGPARAAAAAATLRLAATLADAVVCSSEAIARQFAARRGAIVTTIHPGIGAGHDGGDGARLRGAHDLDDAWPLVTVVGNITSGRGQDLVVRALPAIRERFPDAACLLAGSPHPRPVDRAFRDELARLARAMGVGPHVAFAGFVDPIADAYAAGDVLVNPARFNEPFGRVALEALVAGCPVVATRVGAIPEVLRDERDALLVPPENPAAIAAAVTRLAGDRELARRLTAEGRRRVLADFGEDRVADEFERVAARVVSGAARRSA